MLDNNYLKFRAAVHEAGHALVAKQLPFITKINKVIIENKNNKPFGYTDFSSQDNWYGAQDAYVVLAAGLAADYLAFGKLLLDEAQQDLRSMQNINENFGNKLKIKKDRFDIPNLLLIESIAGKGFSYAYNSAMDILSSNKKEYYAIVDTLNSNNIMLDLK